MANTRSDSPMRIRLSDERKVRVLDSIKQHFADHFDEPLSDFRAQALLDFFDALLGFFGIFGLRVANQNFVVVN